MTTPSRRLPTLEEAMRSAGMDMDNPFKATADEQTGIANSHPDKLEELRNMSTVSECDGFKFHESIFRSYNILRKVRQWCEAGVPSSVIGEWIDHLTATL